MQEEKNSATVANPLASEPPKAIGDIIGPDLFVRDGQVITVPEKRDRHDRSIRGYKKRLKIDPDQVKAEVDLIIKNTYRILMARGMKGWYVFCSDEETDRYIRSSLYDARSIDLIGRNVIDIKVTK